ncbi:5'/3'-nucleotidase SurE [Oceanicaulis sp. LC35]|uniref:5'/3'-nucleotidase SurE n=1 Tax=Oceanicaulis sp. LC35 TaxID=3349635 RepID=UPI003F8314E5
MSQPRILLVNDDGIHAPGLKVLEEIARTLSDDVWTVAPAEEQSGMGRALTLNAPLRVQQYDDKRFSVSGTPTDCVHMAMDILMKDARPDLLLSGVNSGQNIAEDVTMSGTVAAAMHGVQMGVQSIALSQAYGFEGRAKIRWETSREHGPRVLKALLDAPWSQNTLLNVNFPDRAPDQVAGVEVTAQGQRDQVVLHADARTDLRGRDYYWLGFNGKLSDPAAGTDLRAVYDGRISITPLHLDLTNYEARTRLKTALGETLDR